MSALSNGRNIVGMIPFKPLDERTGSMVIGVVRRLPSGLVVEGDAVALIRIEPPRPERRIPWPPESPTLADRIRARIREWST
ncbi:MAG: hypothetical protein O9296_01820 [Novosphingobium sp.]|nr:hypothetical protein [Novosphingobium sp.]